jgi:hypothetical protein
MLRLIYFLFGAALVLCVWSLTARADVQECKVYKWVDDYGVTHFVDHIDKMPAKYYVDMDCWIPSDERITEVETVAWPHKWYNPVVEPELCVCDCQLVSPPQPFEIRVVPNDRSPRAYQPVPLP